MTSKNMDHLSPEERQALQPLQDDLQTTGDVPDPSPLFWHHLSERIHAAVDAEPIPRRVPWYLEWRPLVAAGAMAAIVLAVTLARPNGPATAPASAIDAAVAADTDDFSGAMNVVAQFASDLSFDDLRQIAQPTHVDTANLIENLTPAEREEFLKKLKAVIDKGE